MADTVEQKPATQSASGKAQEIISRFDSLKGKRMSFYDAAWRSAAEWLMPRKSSLLGAEKTPGEAGWVDNLFDITGMKANERLAAWLMTNTSPADSRWFAFRTGPRTRARLGMATQAADSWWQVVTETTLEILQASKFYTAKHEAVLDRNTFGTCNLNTQKGRKTPVNFRSIPAATYVIASDDEGDVDTVMREFKLTVRQAVQQFGIEAVGDQIREKWNMENGTGRDTEFCFIHAVFPNSDRNPAYDDAMNKAFRSCYVCREDKKIVQEGGYDEMPYAVSRFLAWTGEDWGWAPAFTALPVVRETNFVKMQMNALLELGAFPPLAIPDSLQGMVDMRSGGQTVYDANRPDALPHALHDVHGDPKAGEFWLTLNRQDINDCFYGDVIAMFSNLDREVTAYEAAQLAGEKLDVFAPYYHRLINELDTPTLKRVFSILLAEGVYPPPPPELIEDMGDGSGNVDFPEVVYLSRLALAIQAHEIGSFDALVARAQQLAAIDPALGAQFMSPYDLERASRGLGRNLGVPVDWQKPPEQLEAEKQAAAEAAQGQAMAEAAPKLAKAAKDVDSLSGASKNRLAGNN